MEYYKSLAEKGIILEGTVHRDRVRTGVPRCADNNRSAQKWMRNTMPFQVLLKIIVAIYIAQIIKHY